MNDGRRRFLLIGSAMAAAGYAGAARAEPVRVVESLPAASAVVGRRGTDFYVRFDRPVDHEKSTLVVMRGATVVERLVPRLESAPDVLFARAPTLPEGSYSLLWTVRTIEGVEVTQGEIPFAVKD
ncbi:MAG: hypothetical protein U1E23_16160 [Reyranellaceae bacterium]